MAPRTKKVGNHWVTSLSRRHTWSVAVFVKSLCFPSALSQLFSVNCSILYLLSGWSHRDEENEELLIPVLCVNRFNRRIRTICHVTLYTTCPGKSCNDALDWIPSLRSSLGVMTTCTRPCIRCVYERVYVMYTRHRRMSIGCLKLVIINSILIPYPHNNTAVVK